MLLSKKHLKRIISCMLVLMLMVPMFTVAFAADDDFGDLPVVYLKGQGSNLSAVQGTKDEVIYPIEIPDGYIGDRCKELAIPLAKAMATGEWKEYGDGLYEAITPFTDKIKCDNNGEVTNGSGPSANNTKSATPIRPGSKLLVYYYAYDWRLDPVDIIDDLHDYITFVKEKEGTDKINVLARCLGANVIIAYMDKYGSEDIAQCLICSSGFEGFNTIGAIFSGEIELDADAIERFSSSYLATDGFADDPTFEIVRYLVTCINYIPVLDFSADTLTMVLNGIHDDCMRRLIRDSFGTMPAFWSYVGDEYYEKAKAYLFDGVEDEFAGLIEKIDYYHYEILNNYETILDNAEADGTLIYNVCKYGFQAIPVTGNDLKMNDTLADTACSSMGATCATVNGTLSAAYLKNADMKYVSPDKQIDASTCRYPDHTWFIKNLAHQNMPTCIDDVFAAILEAPGYTTVNDLEEYPQFLIASDDSTRIVPQTKDNTTELDKFSTSPLKAVILLFVRLINMLFGNLFK